MNLIQGIDMFEMLNQIDLLDNNESRFYIGSIILCLECLHSQGIIYRDLKPENLMIQSNGYLRLIDMGTAKILSKNEKTFSIIGTPHYMAPEVIQGRGYSFYADLWALGICMFEFQCGYVAFGEDEDDPFEIYKIVLTKDHSYPDYFMDEENEQARFFMDLLLSKIPEARCNEDYTLLKGHPWFEGFNWNDLLEARITPPY